MLNVDSIIAQSNSIKRTLWYHKATYTTIVLFKRLFEAQNI